jgi:hypothetical protein
MREIGKLGKGARIGAYADAVIRANAEGLKEAMEMSRSRRRSKVTLEQVLEETGLIAEWVARGRAAGEAIGEAREKRKGSSK